MVSISIIIINDFVSFSHAEMDLKMAESISILVAIEDYLDNILLSRAELTFRSYRNGLNLFKATLEKNGINPRGDPIEKLTEDAIAWFATSLKKYSPATERLYLSSAVGFFEFIAAERIAEPNLPRIRLLVRQRARRVGQRLPQFPRESIEQIVNYFTNSFTSHSSKRNEFLRTLRNKAFIITLADSGLRVHEACSLRRGDVDWNEGKAIVLGKGDQQSIVRFSSRAVRALKDYLRARSELDGISGRPLPSLPLFARHDRGAGKKIKPITTTTGRNIVRDVVKMVLGEDAVGTITPHSFRHYFVTTVLRGSGGNLKLAQELARHKNIQVTQRYAHLSNDELDQRYYEIFEK
jgi:site-specific recombinase XerD